MINSIQIQQIDVILVIINLHNTGFAFQFRQTGENANQIHSAGLNTVYPDAGKGKQIQIPFQLSGTDTTSQINIFIIKNEFRLFSLLLFSQFRELFQQCFLLFISVFIFSCGSRFSSLFFLGFFYRIPVGFFYQIVGVDRLNIFLINGQFPFNKFEGSLFICRRGLHGTQCGKPVIQKQSDIFARKLIFFPEITHGCHKGFFVDDISVFQYLRRQRKGPDLVYGYSLCAPAAPTASFYDLNSAP